MIPEALDVNTFMAFACARVLAFRFAGVSTRQFLRALFIASAFDCFGTACRLHDVATLRYCLLNFHQTIATFFVAKFFADVTTFQGFQAFFTAFNFFCLCTTFIIYYMPTWQAPFR